MNTAKNHKATHTHTHTHTPDSQENLDTIERLSTLGLSFHIFAFR